MARVIQKPVGAVTESAAASSAISWAEAPAAGSAVCAPSGSARLAEPSGSAKPPTLFKSLPESAAKPMATRPLSCRSEEHTSELQSLMRNSYAVFCLKKKNTNQHVHHKKPN